MKQKNEKILKHWQEKALTHGDNQTATHTDIYLRDLEINALSSKLCNGIKVIDVGCGNGHSTFQFAKKFPESTFIGVDYSSEMIREAQSAAKKHNLDNITFEIMDLLKPSKKFFGEFDVALTERCIINLSTHLQQVDAFRNLCQLVKIGGRILLSEETIQAYNNINNLRLEANLDPMSIQWHNLYIDFPKFLKDTCDSATLNEEVNFSSSYYLATRYYKALLYKQFNLNPGDDLDSDFHKFASGVPHLGDFGLLKLLVFQKL